MHCFEWNTHLSDFLDGTIEPGHAEPLQSHLADCHDCQERVHRHQVLVSALRNQTVYVSATDAGHSSKTKAWRRTWIRTREWWIARPWLIRNFAEGAALAVSLVLLFAWTPKIKVLYDQYLERKFHDSNPGVLAPESASENPLPSQTPETASTTTDELDVPALPDKVGEGEIWRINITTESLADLKQDVRSVLHGASGLEENAVPGGIQFSMVLPKENVLDVTKRLEGLSRGKKFSWFKSPYRKELAAGKTRVVVWITEL